MKALDQGHEICQDYADHGHHPTPGDISGDYTLLKLSEMFLLNKIES